MGNIIFILGGARSGKSSYAVKLAREIGKKTIFIATCIMPDREMKKRIKLHRILRPRSWKTITESKDISKALIGLRDRYDVVIIDCLGLLIANLLAEELEEEKIIKRLKGLAKVISTRKHTIILVSNEVGNGIVPDNPLARRFRDLVGFANQVMAQKADEVIFMQSGIPIRIKGGNNRCKD